MARVIAVTNQKGGVGKTTTAVNLSACLAVQGKKVLLLDTDPQGNATSGIGLEKRELKFCIYDALINEMPLQRIIRKSQIEGLDVVPATIQLAGAEIELVSTISREVRLRSVLEEVREAYDYIIIDCPPSLGLLTLNALSAADTVLVPIQCEYYALEGLGQLTNTINLVKKHLNSKLVLEGVLLNVLINQSHLRKNINSLHKFKDSLCVQ